MSGFVSKISAAGSKGWTGLQSLWDRDNKGTLTSSNSGPPAEKTSLLSLALPSRYGATVVDWRVRHPRGSRLLSEEDDWTDSAPEDSKASSDRKPSPTPKPRRTPSPKPKHTPTPSTTHTTSSPRIVTKAESPVAPPSDWISEDENDMWLKSDSAHRGILDTDKKKSTRESKRPSPRFKHKTTSSSAKGGDWKYSEKEKGFTAFSKLKGPAFGKLLDTECDEGEGVHGSSSAGCDNKVWASDDEGDAQWKMMEGGLGSKAK